MFAKITIEEALFELEALRVLLQESVKRDDKPSNQEMEYYGAVVEKLHSSGYEVYPVTWRQTQNDSGLSKRPPAHQVLKQVEMLSIRLRDMLPDQKERTQLFPVQKGYVFIIMAMSDDLQLPDIHEAIKLACQSHGLSAQRVDEIEDTGRITDNIIECIRKAEIVIADLTLNRPNCFYEAGYAHGFGREVIFTARKGTVLEFDIKDYQVTFYENTVTLRNKLTKRLGAVLEKLRKETSIEA